MRRRKKVVWVCLQCGGRLNEKRKCENPEHEGIAPQGWRLKHREELEADRVLLAYPHLRETVFGPSKRGIMHLCDDPDFEGFD